MNIFFLHPNARRCARWHCNKHVVKMILETAQLLYTAHWVLEMAENRLPCFKDAPLQKSSSIEDICQFIIQHIRLQSGLESPKNTMSGSVYSASNCAGNLPIVSKKHILVRFI